MAAGAADAAGNSPAGIDAEIGIGLSGASLGETTLPSGPYFLGLPLFFFTGPIPAPNAVVGPIDGELIDSPITTVCGAAGDADAGGGGGGCCGGGGGGVGAGIDSLRFSDLGSATIAGVPILVISLPSIMHRETLKTEFLRTI